MLPRLIAFFVLSGSKIVSHLFYRGEYEWPPGNRREQLQDLRLLLFLNHTSLFEPLFLSGLPFHFLWRMSGHTSLPGADVTLNRPLVGKFWKMLAPRITPITRKRDESWDLYLNSIRPDDIVLMAPEGRMKRANGLDKDGQKMTVRGGVADILERIPEGRMLICLSGGLHHVQAPGERFPRIFQTIRMRLQLVDIAEYKARFPGSPKERKIQVMQDLQRRLEQDRPS